jgi:hypothetical protein
MFWLQCVPKGRGLNVDFSERFSTNSLKTSKFYLYKLSVAGSWATTSPL